MRRRTPTPDVLPMSHEQHRSVTDLSNREDRLDVEPQEATSWIAPPNIPPKCPESRSRWADRTLSSGPHLPSIGNAPTRSTHAVNSAADTDTVVVIDPDPIRCDDSFATSLRQAPELSCADHVACRPVAARAVSRGVIMIAGEHSSWLVDVAAGRFCQTDSGVDVHFISPEAWTPVVAVCVMPASMSALTTSGTLITSKRAHRAQAIAS